MEKQEIFSHLKKSREIKYQPNFVSKNVDFMDSLLKYCHSKFLKIPHCDGTL